MISLVSSSVGHCIGQNIRLTPNFSSNIQVVDRIIKTTICRFHFISFNQIFFVVYEPLKYWIPILAWPSFCQFLILTGIKSNEMWNRDIFSYSHSILSIKELDLGYWVSNWIEIRPNSPQHCYFIRQFHFHFPILKFSKYNSKISICVTNDKIKSISSMMTTFI